MRIVSAPALLPIALVLAFGTACPKKAVQPVTHTDAGPVDAGPVDAGPMDAGPQDIGGACAQDTDCTSTHCYTASDGGYCINSCTDNTGSTGCNSNAACEQISGRSGYCLLLCMSNSDCRAGTKCAPGYDVCVPENGCATNTDCPNGVACNAALGLCTGAIGAASTIGAPCTSSSMCTVGTHPICLDAMDGFNGDGGYCSSFCAANTDCGSKAVCIENVFQGGPSTGACLETCRNNASCRAGYNCGMVAGNNVCVPNCQTDADCFDSSQTCDTTSGVCTAADAGMSDGGETDAGVSDAGMMIVDAGPFDAGPPFVWDGGYPGPFPTPPQVLNAGGPVLTAPKLVPVFFSNDDPTIISSVEQFDSTLGSTSYWTATTSEYGVSAATGEMPIQLPDIATGTISDADIQFWIAQQISAGTLPASDSNTLYLLHYPPYVTITLQGSRSCRSFGGYHNGFDNGAHRIAYAVVPRCGDPNTAGDVLGQETEAESHEIIEATTDPFPDTDPAYVQVDAAHILWAVELGGGSELGDMCEANPSSFTEFPGFPFAVQRTWSNASALAGNDPCVPIPTGEVFFDAAPVMSDTVGVVVGSGAPDIAAGVQLAPGGTVTIPVDVWSTAATSGPLTIAVGPASGGMSAFTYTLNQTTAQNGDRLYLTITSPASNPTGTQEIFAVSATLGTASNGWLGVVGQ